MESEVINVPVEKKLKQARLPFHVLRSPTETVPQPKKPKLHSTEKQVEVTELKENIAEAVNEPILVDLGDEEEGTESGKKTKRCNFERDTVQDSGKRIKLDKDALSYESKCAPTPDCTGKGTIHVSNIDIIDKERVEDVSLVGESNGEIMEVDIDKESPTQDTVTDSDIKPPSTPKAASCKSPETTPRRGKLGNRKQTPQQLQREQEIQKKREEREQEKLEKDKKRQEEKEQKEEQKRKLKEEKEKKRLSELEQKNEEKQRKLDERKKREEQKMDEKRKKEEERMIEKKRKEEEKNNEKKKREEEEAVLKKKKTKEAEVFSSFFKKVDIKAGPRLSEQEAAFEQVIFMPFMVKPGMRMAPINRNPLDPTRRAVLEDAMLGQQGETYLLQLRVGERIPLSSGNTRPLEDKEDKDDVIILGLDINETSQSAPSKQTPRHQLPKLLQFNENRRPPYWGTWRKKSLHVGPRRPFGQDKALDYEVDSDDEWEEEEPGESLHGSDDEKEPEDDYEVDNDFFVPHGYLSDDENNEEESLSPETQKAKLKLMGEQFDLERSEKNSRQLRPITIGCIWFSCETDEPASVNANVLRLLNQRCAVLWEDSAPIPVFRLEEDGSPSLDSSHAESTSSSSRRSRQVPDIALPAVIRLVHGSIRSLKYLAREFVTFWSRESGEELTLKCVRSKMKELAVWQDKLWVVSQEARDHHGLADLTLNNSWHFVTLPKKQFPEAALPDLVRMIHGSANSLEFLAGEFAAWWTTDNRTMKKSYASAKIQEVATWKEGLEEGGMCWCVSEEVRQACGLEALTLGNMWQHTVPEQVDKSPRITKFIKKMTEEERQTQLKGKTTGCPTPNTTPKPVTAAPLSKYFTPVRQDRTAGHNKNLEDDEPVVLLEKKSADKSRPEVKVAVKKRVSLVSVPLHSVVANTATQEKTATGQSMEEVKSAQVFNSSERVASASGVKIEESTVATEEAQVSDCPDEAVKIGEVVAENGKPAQTTQDAIAGGVKIDGPAVAQMSNFPDETTAAAGVESNPVEDRKSAVKKRVTLISIPRGVDSKPAAAPNKDKSIAKYFSVKS